MQASATPAAQLLPHILMEVIVETASLIAVWCAILKEYVLFARSIPTATMEDV